MVGRHANSMKKPRGTIRRGNIWKWLERKGCHPQERRLRRGSQSSVGQRHCTEFHFRNIKLGNFLVGQWLTHCASTAGGVGLIPGWGTKILHAVCYSQERKKKNLKFEVLLGFSNGIQSNRQSESKSWVRRSKMEICKSYDCSHKIKRCFLLGRKAMKNPDSILKSRDIILPTEVCTVKAMVFPVVMYGCESWTIKKVESRRIDAFKLWYWRRLLRVAWTARSNQSILQEINPEYSSEGLLLEPKLQYFGHLM